MSRRPKRHRRSPVHSTESRSIELATTAWMLTTVTALACQVMTVISRLYVALVDPNAELMEVFSGLLLFTSAVLGVVVLGLGAVVLRWRKQRPPRSIVVFAHVVGVAPLVAALVLVLSPR